jgi:hypothetical protein
MWPLILTRIVDYLSGKRYTSLRERKWSRNHETIRLNARLVLRSRSHRRHNLLLNQSKAVFLNNRRFENIERYRELRDDFLTHYSECLKRVADAQP